MARSEQDLLVAQQEYLRARTFGLVEWNGRDRSTRSLARAMLRIAAIVVSLWLWRRDPRGR